MGALAPVPDQSVRSFLRLTAIAAMVVSVAAAMWFELRSRPQPTAAAPREIEPMPKPDIIKSASEVQVIAVEDSTNAPMPNPRPAVVAETSPVLDAQVQTRIDTAIALAQNSPTEALRWAWTLPLAERTAAVVAAANEAARSKPAEALAALADLEASPERDAGLAHAASQWATLDPKAASEWAVGGAPGKLRDQICTAVAIAMADRDPRAAADFLVTQTTDGLLLRNAAVAVVQRWAQKDAVAARAWAEQFPSGPLRNDALREVELQRQASASLR